MAKSRFSKVLGQSDVIVTAFGAMIGWGWVVSSGEWIQTAGVIGTILSFLIGGLIIFFVGLTYAELTTALPQCGGEHVFSFRAFGSVGSFICSWALVLSYIGVVCFEACALPTIIQYIYPPFLQGYLYTVAGFDIYATWLITAIILAIIITYINMRGIKTAAFVQKILTFVIAAVGILLVVASLFTGKISNLDGQAFTGFGGFDSFKNILAIAVVTPFFLLGFDVIPQVAEEINIPLKKVGKLLLLSIVLAVTFYALVVFAVGFALNSTELTNASKGAGLVTADAMAKAFNSNIMSKVLIIGGMCGIVTSWNSFLIGGSRVIYAMGEANMLPSIFSKLHPTRKTPKNAIILVGILSIVSVFFGRQMLVWISNSASFACCVAYCIVSMSFLVLRKKEPELERPYKIKHYKFVGIIASVLSGLLVVMYLIPNFATALSTEEFIIIGGWTLLGIVFAISCKLKYKNKFGNIPNIEI
ncbi:MAG: APC family permease [Acutalibacteraceae bacterium]|nr:APC family permease [Acutalibacteraceae bacterium]